MEIIGMVLLIGTFLLGLAAVYVFLQYLDLLKSVRVFQTEILEKLTNLEKNVGTSLKMEQGAGKEKTAEKGAN